MTTPTVPQPRRLPVRRTVGACYAAVAHNLGQLVRISWLWLLIMIPVYAAAHWLVSSDWVLLAPRWVREIAPVVPLVVELPFLASIAVAWHRLVLRHERVSAPAYLRLDWQVWLYVVCALGLLVLTIGPLLPVIAVGGATQYSYGLQDLDTEILLVIVLALAVLGQAVGLFVLPRLSLVLPALALGERLSFSKAWRVSRGNTLRLALATFLCILPAVVFILVAPVVEILRWLFEDLQMKEPELREHTFLFLDSVGYAVFASAGYAVLTIFAVTLLSLAYRFFAAPRAESPSPPA